MVEHDLHFTQRNVDIESMALNADQEQAVENVINVARKYGFDYNKDITIPKGLETIRVMVWGKAYRDALYYMVLPALHGSQKKSMGVLINQFDKAWDTEIDQINSGTQEFVAEKDEATQA